MWLIYNTHCNNKTNNTKHTLTTQRQKKRDPYFTITRTAITTTRTRIDFVHLIGVTSLAQYPAANELLFLWCMKCLDKTLKIPDTVTTFTWGAGPRLSRRNLCAARELSAADRRQEAAHARHLLVCNYNISNKISNN